MKFEKLYLAAVTLGTMVGAASANDMPEEGKTMEKATVVELAEVDWITHPRVTGAENFPLYAKQDEKEGGVTCIFSHLPPDTVVKKHTHESDEIIYVIKGTAMMHIEGSGEIPVKAGTFLRIPKGVAHYPYNIREDFYAYNVFYPFLD